MPQIIERLIDDREADDGVDDIAVDAKVEEHAQQHRRGMTHGEEADVNRDVLQPIKEEDHREEEQDMIVACHHMLGAKVNELEDVNPADLLDVALVAFGDGM
jgi:hypothetical protein